MKSKKDMSEQDINNTQAEQTTATSTDEQAEQPSAETSGQGVAEQSGGESAKSKKSAKGAKGAKDGKKSAASAKEQTRLKKEWEDSIVASKKVKHEEMRRKLKRAMLIMLVFSLIVTSIVYVMLLFIQENNIRITASNRNKEKSISLSMDNDFWTPYLNAEGPEKMWNISYDSRYGTEKVDTKAEIREKLELDNVEIGAQNGQQFIRFVFMLKNTGNEAAHINYEMTLEFDKQKRLHDAVRVAWGQSFKNEDHELDKETDVKVYAALSQNERLLGSNINAKGDGTYRTIEEGLIEYVAYPNEFTTQVHKNDKYYYVKNYETTVDSATRIEDMNHGFVATTPFHSDKFVFKREANMGKGDIMYCYVSIWLEGSDFECINDRLGGYCKLGLNFYAS